MLRIEMLPAGHGDALWIEYGHPDDIHRILVDGGPAHSYEDLRWRILNLPAGERHFELLVVTHIDADHIEGVIKLLQDEECACTFGDIWFNGWEQLKNLPAQAPDISILGPVQGEFLGALIQQNETQLWNGPWQGGALFIPSSPAEKLPVVDNIPGGLKITVLSPLLKSLVKLKSKWDDVVREAGFTPGDKDLALSKLKECKWLGPPPSILGARAFSSKPDSSIANGSSIALLVEHEESRILLAGDAYASTLVASLKKWLTENSKDYVKLDVFKLPHHGSCNNISGELIELIRCKNYLISTNGDRFNHPDSTTIECILDNHKLRGKPNLHFNYRSDETDSWAQTDNFNGKYYKSHFPVGLQLNLY